MAVRTPQWRFGDGVTGEQKPKPTHLRSRNGQLYDIRSGSFVRADAEALAKKQMKESGLSARQIKKRLKAERRKA